MEDIAYKMSITCKHIVPYNAHHATTPHTPLSFSMHGNDLVLIEAALCSMQSLSMHVH